MDVSGSALKMLDYGGLGLALAIVIASSYIGLKSVNLALKYLHEREGEMAARETEREERILSALARNATFLEETVAQGRAERQSQFAAFHDVSQSTVGAIAKNTETMELLCDKVNSIHDQLKDTN